MAEVYQFSNGENWNQIYNVTKTAEREFNATVAGFRLIPDFVVPVTTESRAIAIFVETNNNPGRWVRGGFCRRFLLHNRCLVGIWVWVASDQNGSESERFEGSHCDLTFYRLKQERYRRPRGLATTNRRGFCASLGSLFILDFRCVGLPTDDV